MLIGRSAQEMADELVDRALSTGSRRDDSVALVLRRVPRSASWRALPTPAAVTMLRSESRAWLTAHAVPSETIEDLALVVSELLSNAVRAARSEVGLSVSITNDMIVVEVDDDGTGDATLDARGRDPIAAGRTDGRGLFVVRTLTDDVSIVSTTEGTIVKSAVSLRARRGAPAGRR